MKVAVTDGRGKLWLDEAPLPAIGPFDCLVRIECCAFCNSTDQHIVNGMPAFGLQYPALLGHESVGVVVEAGAKVRHLAVGDRVLRVYAVYPDAQLDGYHSAWGGFADYGVVTDWQAMAEAGALSDDVMQLRYQQRVPAEIGPAQASLLIPQKEVWSASGRAGSLAGKRVLVTGAGIVGLLFARFAKLRDAAHVTIVARRREALDRVMEHGAADDVRLFDADDAPASPYDLLFETTGSLEAAKRVLPLLQPNGAVFGYAVYDEPTGDTLADHPFQTVGPDEAGAHEEVCDMVLSGQLDQRSLITHEFPFDDLEAAWQTVIQRRTMKTLVRMA